MKKAKISPGVGISTNAVESVYIEQDCLKTTDLNDTADLSLKTTEKLKMAAKKASLKKNALQVISNVKSGVNKWKKYVTTRRKLTQNAGDDNTRRKMGGIGLEYDLHQPISNSEIIHRKGKDRTDGKQEARVQMVVTHNRNLIEYFARLGQSKEEDECVNLEYLESIIKAGANINCTDKYGQSIFHEVARAWHVDVAKFLLYHKADINQADNYGRTPLHVAAAVDYPEMVTFLIEHGANKEAVSKGERQTPVHFAARNDACLSLKALLKNDCLYKNVRDYKGRTPLHVAAELDRSETARFLLEIDDPAPAGVEDLSGQAAITWMIAKMPPVAKLALNQFHTRDRANRKQAYHLQRLEPRKPKQEEYGFPQSPMQVLVRFRRLDLIEHPIFLTLIKAKWKKYGRLGAIINLIFNCIFILLWTIQGVLVEYDVRYDYKLPSQWWRIVLFAAAIFFTGWQLKDELTEYYNSRKMHNKWKNWRDAEIDKDLNYAHPRWPEEARYLLNEKDLLDQQRPQYFTDFWNIFDWICYTLLLVCIITHLVDVGYHTTLVARLHIRIMSVTIIVIWLRFLKNARAFSYLGPFIVMLTHMLSDVIRFGFLYLEFYFPFACAFWMLFGGTKVPQAYLGQEDASNHTMTVNGMSSVDALLFTLFRLTLVDDYDYDGMKAIDSIMADIIIGAWLALSAILMLNLLIALLSDTFQRVYDNARANAVMQKAIAIIGIEEGLSHKRREKFRRYIHEKCAPKEEEYDDDEVEQGGEDLQKVTIQIKEQLDEMEHKLQHGMYNKKPRINKSKDTPDEQNRQRINSMHSINSVASANDDDELISRRTFISEVQRLHSEMKHLQTNQNKQFDKFKRDMRGVQDLLQELIVLNRSAEQLPLGDLLPNHFSQSGIVAPVQVVAAPPPMYSSHSSLPLGRFSQLPQSTSGLHTPVHSDNHSLALLEQNRTQELQQLRHTLGQRGNLNGARVSDDILSTDGILSGSQLVVEVSEQNISQPAPPPYRSDSDSQQNQSPPGNETNC